MHFLQISAHSKSNKLYSMAARLWQVFTVRIKLPLFLIKASNILQSRAVNDFEFVFYCLINIKHTVGRKNKARCHFKSRTDPIYCYTSIFILNSLLSFI